MALTTAAEVAAMLRWGTAEQTKYAGQLPAYIAAASQIIESEAGPFEARTVEHIADGAPSIALPTRVNEVETVLVGSSTDGAWVDGYYVPVNDWASPATWTLDAAAGIVYGPFPRGRQNIKITYTTGYAADAIPEAAKLAATMVAVDMWAVASQRTSSLDDQVDPSYLMPKVVRNLLAPFKTMPGFA